MKNRYLLVFCATDENDPLFEVLNFATNEEAVAYCHLQYGEKKWNGPKIEIFRFNHHAYGWTFLREVIK